MRLQYTRLTLWQLGWRQWRYLFPWLFVVTALYYFSTPSWDGCAAVAGLALPTGLALVLYYPRCSSLWRGTAPLQKWLIYLSLGWIALFGTRDGIACRRAGNVRIRYIRTSAVLRCVMLLSVTALYAVLPAGPGRCACFTRMPYMAHRELWYANLSLAGHLWCVVLAANTVSLLLGSVSMMSVARMKWSGPRRCAPAAQIRRGQPGVAAFLCTASKTQFAGRPLTVQRLAEQLDADQPDLAALRSCAAVAGEQRRPDLPRGGLYKSFKSNALSMRRCSLTVIVQGAVEGAAKEYPAAGWNTVPEGLYVLADEAHLRAAITNLLVNGWEATVSAGKTEPIAVTCYEKQRGERHLRAGPRRGHRQVRLGQDLRSFLF